MRDGHKVLKEEITSRGAARKKTHTRKRRGTERRMGEDGKRGLGCAYVISDSTFGRVSRIFNCPCPSLPVEMERKYLLKGKNKPSERQDDEGLGLKVAGRWRTT